MANTGSHGKSLSGTQKLFARFRNKQHRKRRAKLIQDGVEIRRHVHDKYHESQEVSDRDLQYSLK